MSELLSNDKNRMSRWFLFGLVISLSALLLDISGNIFVLIAAFVAGIVEASIFEVPPERKTPILAVCITVVCGCSIVALIQSNRREEKLLAAISGDIHAPLVTLEHRGETSGIVKLENNGSVPLYDVQIQITDLDAQQSSEKDSKLAPVASSTYLSNLPDSPVHILPGWSLELPFEKFPVTDKVRFEIFIRTRIKHFIQRCYLNRNTQTAKFASSCVVLEP